MSIIDLSLVLDMLKRVSDDALRGEIVKYGLRISDAKFALAFSAYGVTRWLTSLPHKVLSINAPSLPTEELDRIRWSAVFFFRAYTTFIFMRSEHLERGLDTIPEDSPIRPFRDFFRSGSIRRGEDTIAQHIRNALAHGTVEIENIENLSIAVFHDRDWQGKIALSQFVDGLCEEIFRFYCAAFETRQGAA
ncbi:MAG: hypothetical protein QXS54_12465 [Candidatus Methanomethylicaceae archaeon]